ncbi:hypothetical protein ACFPMF_16020 [Larkinella bovis]|uniref:FRG domain-containing protein n=1 Tax=Larkinella bovis TaxID=683041 RepID=A0ABW0IC02_9BACT
MGKKKAGNKSLTSKSHNMNDTDLLELIQWWDVIRYDWGITREMLGEYLNKKKAINSRYGGYSASEILYTIKGAREAKVNKFKRLLGDIFHYDFKNGSPVIGREDDHNNVRDSMTSIRKSNIPMFTIDLDLQIAESFSGLYYCFACNRDQEKILPFLFYIRKDGSVELAGKGQYYKKGYIVAIDLNVYFFLDSARNHSPELYITSISKRFKDNYKYVKEFIMCGVWSDGRTRPAHGSCLLINQSKKDDIRNLIKDSELSKTLENLLRKKPALNSLSNNIFEIMEQEYDSEEILKDLKHRELMINTLDFDEYVNFEPR